MRITCMLAVALLVFNSNYLLAQTDTAIDTVERLNKFRDLHEFGEINDVEYAQLRNELLGITPEDVKMYKRSRSQKIAGSILIFAGAGIITLGITQMNASVTPGMEDSYKYRVKLNKRTGIGIISAGSITSFGGVILTSLGIAKAKKFKIKNAPANLEVGIMNNGNPGLALQF